MSGRGHDAEKLLAQREWMRELARKLVSDPSLAEDVLQDSCVALLETDPAAIRTDPDAYARGVVRNKSLGARRERRAVAAELDAEHSELPDAEQLLLMEEGFRALNRAVLALPETYRVVVLLRFYEGLEPQEIAARQKKKAVTVRVHLRRAIERLKLMLVKDGDPRVWPGIVLLAGLRFPVSNTALGAASTHPTAAAGRARNRQGVFYPLAGGTLVCAVTAAVILFDGGTGTSRPGGGTTVAEWQQDGVSDAALETPSEAVAEREALASHADALPVDGPAPAAKGWVLEGRAEIDTSPAGLPLRGAPVELELTAGVEPNGDPIVSAVTTADAEGRFSFDVPAHAGLARGTLRIGGDDHWNTRPIEFALLDGRTEPPDLVLAAHPLDDRVTVRVADEDGQGLVGAFVRHAGRRVVTDASGFADVRSSSWYLQRRMDVSAPGYGSRAQSFSAAPGDGGVIDIVLPPEARVVGQLFDGEHPAVGFEVWMGGPPERVRAVRTDASGQFDLGGIHLEALGPRALARVEAAPPGAPPRSFFVAFEGSEPTQATWTLDPVVDVVGTVRGPGGDPVAIARVELGGESTFTRVDGVFRFFGLRPGGSQLAVTATGCAPFQERVQLEARADPQVLEVDLVTGSVVEARVVDEHGVPVPGALVQLVFGDGVGVHTSARADRDGHFRLWADSEADSFALQVFAPGMLATTADADQVSSPGATLVLRQAADIAGMVVDANTRMPLERFLVRFLDPGTRPEGSAEPGHGFDWRLGRRFVSTDGTWNSTASTQLEDGTEALVEVSADGYSTLRLPAVATRGARPADLVFELEPE